MRYPGCTRSKSNTIGRPNVKAPAVKSEFHRLTGCDHTEGGRGYIAPTNVDNQPTAKGATAREHNLDNRFSAHQATQQIRLHEEATLLMIYCSLAAVLLAPSALKLFVPGFT